MYNFIVIYAYYSLCIFTCSYWWNRGIYSGHFGEDFIKKGREKWGKEKKAKKERRGEGKIDWGKGIEGRKSSEVCFPVEKYLPCNDKKTIEIHLFTKAGKFLRSYLKT